MRLLMSVCTTTGTLALVSHGYDIFVQTEGPPVKGTIKARFLARLKLFRTLLAIIKYLGIYLRLN